MAIRSIVTAAALGLAIVATCFAAPAAAPAPAAATAGAALAVTPAQDVQIRKNLAERLPSLPKIDEVNKTPIPGLFEVRIGTELIYSDESGSYLVQGKIIDTRTREDVTQARIDKLTQIDFASLPLQDAMVMKKGDGSRKLVIFADPNCIYCKHFQKDLRAINNVTVYTFLYPILGGDSPEKSRNIWCARNAATVWDDWMVDGKAPPRSMGTCDTPMARNLELGKKYRVTGTPAIVFQDGSRVPGAMSVDQVEKRFAELRSKS